MCGNRGLSNGPASSYVKSFIEELHTRPYMVTKRRCFCNKTFLLGLTVWNKVILYLISPLFVVNSKMLYCHFSVQPFEFINVKENRDQSEDSLSKSCHNSVATVLDCVALVFSCEGVNLID